MEIIDFVAKFPNQLNVTIMHYIALKPWPSGAGWTPDIYVSIWTFFYLFLVFQGSKAQAKHYYQDLLIILFFSCIGSLKATEISAHIEIYAHSSL